MGKGNHGVTLDPMYAPPFTLGVRDLVEVLPADGLRFDPSTFVDVFEKLFKRIRIRCGAEAPMPSLILRPGRRTWSDVVTATQLPKPQPRRREKQAEDPEP